MGRMGDFYRYIGAVVYTRSCGCETICGEHDRRSRRVIDQCERHSLDSFKEFVKGMKISARRQKARERYDARKA